MTDSLQTPPNPYVGPRSFQRNERLYGRDREVTDVFHLLIAERIVLLHSPSGAGKTSLIQAALIPRLEKRKLAVLPTMRVSLDPPPTIELPSGSNCYILSLLLCLEGEMEREEQSGQGMDPEAVKQLAAMKLVDYLDRRREDTGAKKKILIFDQFEEILSIDPTNLEAKNEFFEQVGEVLLDRRYQALFAMREDYMAALAPYLGLLPTRLSTTYRLELLGEEAARAAIQKPAQQVGVEFKDAAAKSLVNDLRRVRIQKPDGTMEESLGPHVEPVQLQVVCHWLWEKKFSSSGMPGEFPATAMQIVQKDVKAMGDVNSALAEYYADRVSTVARQTHIKERTIRNWIDHCLIDEQGIRGQVLQGSERSQGLENSAISQLVDAHLLRAERRRGATWFELAHDRLIRPVQKNNADWFQANLSHLQRRAELWESQGRSHDFLLHGEGLEEAERWAASNQNILTSAEHDFLVACREVRAREQKERRNNRLIRGLAIVAMLVSLLALFFFFNARKSEKRALEAKGKAEEAKYEADKLRKEAERMSRIFLAQALSVQALNRQDETGALLARQAYLFNLRSQDYVLEQVDHALRTVLSAPYFIHTLRGHQDMVLSVAFSPDGQAVASGSWDSTVRLWDLKNPTAKPVILDEHTQGIFTVAFSPDGKILASGSNDRTIRLWNLSRLDIEPRVLEHPRSILSLAFNPNGTMLASGMDNKTVWLWDLNQSNAGPVALEGHAGDIFSVAFSPDEKFLASGSADGTIRLWNPNAPDSSPLVLAEHAAKVSSVAFSPSGKFLASGSQDTTIRLWDLQNLQEKPAILTGHKDEILSIAFNSDGKSLVSTSSDGSVLLWDLQAPDREPVVLPVHGGVIFSAAFSLDGQTLALGASDTTVQLLELKDSADFPIRLSGHGARVNSVAYSPDNRFLASGSGSPYTKNHTVRLWDLQDLEKTPVILHEHEGQVNAVTFNPDGKILASGSADKTIRLWDIQNSGSPLKILEGHKDNVNAIAFSPDGKTLASGSDDTMVRLWDLENPEEFPKILRDHTNSVYAVAFNSDGTILASGSIDNTVRLWDLKNLDAEPIVLDHPEVMVTAVAFSPDGKSLASGGYDKIVRLWDLETAEVVTLLQGHESIIFSVAFSPDGKLLASGSDDRTVRLWDMKNPQHPPLILHNQQGAVLSVAFSPDGQTLALGTEDNMIYIQIVRTETLADYVCQKVWRNLTMDEWYRFIGESIRYECTCPDLPSGENIHTVPNNTN